MLYGKYKDQGLLVFSLALFPTLVTHVFPYILIANVVVTGFEILAFPCNQFGGQEPGTNEEIQETACTRFKAEFPIFDKVILKMSEYELCGDSENEY